MPSKIARCLVAGLAVAGAAAGVQANSNPTTNDNLALNYALQLEYLEAAFYAQALTQFNVTDFANAGYSQGVRDYVVLIAAHEASHVTTLQGVITQNGGTVSPACGGYAFTGTGGLDQNPANFTSIQQFLTNAVTLEDVGVSAYVAALNHLTNQGIQQAAATIATVEARHAAYLRAVTGAGATRNPFPEGVNTARIPDQVVGAAAPFLSNLCTYSLGSANLPAVRPSGVATNNTLANFYASSVTKATNPAPSYTQKQFDDDLGVLNYALTLEHLESSFYTTFNGRFNAAAYNAISTLNGQGDAIVTNIDLIRQHEAAHVSALQGIIAGRGGVAVTAGCYDWSSITTAEQFLAVAQVLEATGVSAYDGAANNITDTGLQQIAAAVAVVEARHAEYLNTLTGKTLNPTPSAFDTASTPATIVSTVSGLPYVVSQQLTGGCSSSSTGSRSGSSTGNSDNGNGNGSSFVAPIAIVSTLLAVVSALLF